MSPVLSICPAEGCPRFTEGGRCEGHRAERNRERNARPWRWVYRAVQWLCVTRPEVLERDGHRCVDCGRHAGELGESELLLCDHVDGLRSLLCPRGLLGQCFCSACVRAFDPDRCQTRCSPCSGRRDGGRTPGGDFSSAKSARAPRASASRISDGPSEIAPVTG